MASRSELTCLTQFSWYLNLLNSNFDLWALIWKGIQYYLQQFWFYPDGMAGSNVNFWSFSESTLGQIWSKLIKILNSLGFDVKNMENVNLVWFWPILAFDQPWVEQGHFGHFNLKWHFDLSFCLFFVFLLFY